MALLTRDRGRRAKAPWLLLILGSVATGCAIFNAFGAGETPFGFNHAVHAEQGLECGDCHIMWDSDDAPGIPTKDGCELCHDPELDAELPPERRISTLFDAEGNYKAQHVSRLSDEVIFSHLQHATKPIECSACHTGIAENTYVDATLALDMADCTSCHRQEQVANDCRTCHERLDVDVAPDSHLFHWTKMHGATVRAHTEGTANDCAMCHQESGCKTCHQAVKPDSHDNFFRRRGHGLHARMDRQSCATCHRSDSCDACHQDTRPLSHNGAFAGTQSTHCVSCHLPVEQSECFTCHKSTPSHALATPLPMDHNPAMNCRLCHGAGQPLPHADNGSDCTSCHR